MGSQRVGHDSVTELNWTDNWLTWLWSFMICNLWAGMKVSGVTQSESIGSRTGANIWRQEKMDVSAQTKDKFALLSPFCFIQTLNRLDDAHPLWWGWSCLVYQLKCWSLPEAPSQTHSKMFWQLSVACSPVTLTHKITSQVVNSKHGLLISISLNWTHALVLGCWPIVYISINQF